MSDKKRLKDDLLDLKEMRLSQNFSETLGVKKALITVPVKKPNRQNFVRVHPGEEMYIETTVLELKEDRESYLVKPNLWAELHEEIVPKALFTAIDRQGVLFLWPVRLPGEDGRQNPWNQSALEAVNMAKKNWVRMAANMSLGAYEVFEAIGDLKEPEWPEESFQEILSIAFKNRLIDDIDHPVIRKLKGKI